VREDTPPDGIFIDLPEIIGITTIPIGIVTDIVITRPGTGYTDGDTIQIGDGCEYTPILTENGSIIGIESLYPCDQEFFTNPPITIITSTGSGAEAFPVVEYKPQYTVDNQDIVGLTSIRTVINCVGIRDLVFVGWVNGSPYYGPYHEHENKRMVGPVHTDRPHPVIYDTKERSISVANVFAPTTSTTISASDNLTPLSPQTSTQTSTTTQTTTQTQVSTPTQTTTQTQVSAPTPTPTPDPTPPPSSPPPSSPPSGGGGSGGGGYGY
jgi:hypothetical protein